MARSQEKAMSMLNRWVDQRRSVESGAGDSARSARFPRECRSSKDGEAARAHVVRQIAALISQIQIATLGEQRIRELNDEINRLCRLKYAWEIQIRKLGGPDYSSMARLGEADGVEAPGQGGYRYFGAAKDLPGVRELLEQQAPADSSKTKPRKELLKHITVEYYGWTDEADYELLEEEKAAEIEAMGRQDTPHEKHRSTPCSTFGGPSESELLPRQTDRVLLQRLLVEVKKEHLIRNYIDSGTLNRNSGTDASSGSGKIAEIAANYVEE